MIPHQGESFSDQSQKEELQIQKRNLPLNRENQILSGKLVQINFRQDCFTNDKRTSDSFPILSKTTENNPSNSPSFEGRIRNIKSRNSILKRQRCHQGNSFNSSKVCKPTLYSSKTLRGETTCDIPCSSEQSHLQSTIQDGRFRKSQILTKPRGLFREDRSFGCLSIHSSPRRLTTIPGIYFQPGHICFQNDAIRAKHGTSLIYKSFQTSFGRSEGTVYSSSHMARRYPSNLKFLFKLHSRSRHCYGPTSEPRFSIKHGKVSPHSNSESHLPRYGDSLVNRDIFSSRREGFSNCSKGNNSKEQESGIGEGNLPVYRNVLSYSPCSKGSSSTLSSASAPSDNLTEKKLLLRNQCYSVKFMLLPLALQDLDWWIHNLSTSISNPIILPPPDIYIQTDASDLGWGGYLKPLRTSGMWTRSQLFWHINRKELMAIFLSLKFFVKSQENVHVQIMTDNSTSVSYLNHMGGTKSVTLSNLALEIWRCSLRKAIHISAVHVAGLLNIFADPLSRFQLLSTEWMLCKRIFRQMVAVYGCPQIDLFTSSQNHQLKTYCSWIADPKALKIDAFTFS